MVDTSSRLVGHAGAKRAHSSSLVEGHDATKRRKIRHRLRHVCTPPNHIEAAPQDPVFVQGQLLKSISASLVVAGFDGVKPSALEMFRSHVEEYMLRFLGYARLWMHDGRRTRPTAHDFAGALSMMPNSATASLLKPQLGLQIPEAISLPSITQPDDPPPPAPDFSSLLQPLMSSDTPPFVPRHFPILPPGHTWVQTPVYPAREKDAQNIREKATEEGILAEQALRRLAKAAQVGTLTVERERRSPLLSDLAKKMDRSLEARRRKKLKQDSMGDAVHDIDEDSEMADLSLDGTAEGLPHGEELDMPDGLAVDQGMHNWRNSGARNNGL